MTWIQFIRKRERTVLPPPGIQNVDPIREPVVIGVQEKKEDRISQYSGLISVLNTVASEREALVSLFDELALPCSVGEYVASRGLKLEDYNLEFTYMWVCSWDNFESALENAKSGIARELYDLDAIKFCNMRTNIIGSELDSTSLYIEGTALVPKEIK